MVYNKTINIPESSGFNFAYGANSSRSVQDLIGWKVYDTGQRRYDGS